MATVPERVNSFLSKENGQSICDSCIQSNLKLSQPQQVQQITSTLATTREFVREKGRCDVCENMKMVTRHT